MAKVSDLLLEYRQEGRNTWAIRFYQDGLVKEYSDSEMAFENDKMVTHARPLAWRELARLSSSELEKLLADLKSVDFFSLPEQMGDPKRVKDGIQFTWTLKMGGQKKTVLAFGPEASTHPALKKLSGLIQDVTANAFDRETGKNGSDV